MLAARLVRVLAAVAADPQAAVHRVQVLDEAERRQMLTGWNGTAAPVPAVRAGCHELVAARAAAGPDAVAVVGGRRWRGRTGGWTGGRGGWRGCCGVRGRGRRRWWGCAWSAARR